MDTQEWLSSNANRRLPFAEASVDAAGVDLDVLREWLLDLRVFISPWEEVDCWISRIEFDSEGVLTLESEELTLDDEELSIGSAHEEWWVGLEYEGAELVYDEAPLVTAPDPAGETLRPDGSYRITLSNAEGVVAQFSIEIREDDAVSDVGRKRYAYDGSKVIMLVPGEAWETPDALGLTELGAVTFTTPEEIESTRIHPTNVNTDIRSFKGFYLTAPYFDSGGNKITDTDEAVPAAGEEPQASFNKLQAGYNIQLGVDDEQFLDLNLVPGAGEGLFPCPDLECKPKVRFINDLSPNDQGNITLEFFDCLRHSGRTDIDPATGLPSAHGIKIYSDCLPCCTCEDYNNTGLAIGRMSAKFKDINQDLNNVLVRSQDAYDEAVAILNDRSPGLVIVYRLEITPDSVCFYLMNISNVPTYAVLSIGVEEAGDIPNNHLTLGGEDLLLDAEELTLDFVPGEGDLQCSDKDFYLESGQSHVQAGVVLTSPPLKDLWPSEQDTGIVDVESVDEWRDLDCTYTIGYGDDFSPIPPATITKACFYSAQARTKLQALLELCPNFQLTTGGPLGLDLLNNDPIYQRKKEEYETLDILDSDCLDKDADLGDPGPDPEEGDPAADADRCRCVVQAQADKIRRQELRDDMLARKYELAYDLWICGENVMTEDMENLIDGLRGLKDLVAGKCKDGSHSFDEESNTCSADIYGDDCQASIRLQNVERDKLYAFLPEILADQINKLNEALEDCLSEGMMIDLISDDSIDTSIAGIFGNFNMACKASNRRFDIVRDDFTSEYDCLQKFVNLVALSTQVT